jgi:hypothetical protein
VIHFAVIQFSDSWRVSFSDHPPRDVHRTCDDPTARKDAATIGTTEADSAGSNEIQTGNARAKRIQRTPSIERLITKC